MKIDETNFSSLSKLICPSCPDGKLMFSDGTFFCNRCNSRYPIEDGVADLRIDPSYDTMLDVDVYEETHSINKQTSAAVYKVYDEILKDCRVNMNGSLLEIASGSGYLSHGLVKSSSFSDIHCSDISPRFMKLLRKKVEGMERNNAFFYLFDANHLPFAEGTFDAVIGNSVLHHFANFENCQSA